MGGIQAVSMQHFGGIHEYMTEALIHRIHRPISPSDCLPRAAAAAQHDREVRGAEEEAEVAKEESNRAAQTLKHARMVMCLLFICWGNWLLCWRPSELACNLPLPCHMCSGTGEADI